jgi:hypothetical protein
LKTSTENILMLQSQFHGPTPHLYAIYMKDMFGFLSRWSSNLEEGVMSQFFALLSVAPSPCG